jgi:hypothetical protein
MKERGKGVYVRRESEMEEESMESEMHKAGRVGKVIWGEGDMLIIRLERGED